MNGFTPASTSNPATSVVLEAEAQPGLEPAKGLVLWNHLNENDVSRPDPISIREGENVKELHPLQFEFSRVIEWNEWKEICIPRMQYAATLKIPHLPELLPHEGKMAIVAAGPSVQDHLRQIRAFKVNDIDNLISVNATHDWLIKQGATPRIHVISEHDVEDIELALGGPPHKDVTYYISSCCDQKVFQQLEGYQRVLWHHFLPPQGYQQALARIFKGEFMVAGGYATFFRCMTIAIVLGYRHFDLFGVDSSFAESSHMQGYATSDREPKITVWGADQSGKRLKKFKTQGGLAYQAKEFLEFCKFNHSALKIRIHGDGLLRYVHESRYPEQYQ